MALATCSTCGRELTERAPAFCPHCGTPIGRAPTVPGAATGGHQRRISAAWGCIAPILIVSIVLVFVTIGDAERSVQRIGRSSPEPADPTFEGNAVLRRADFPGVWPFTVEEGVLRCEGAGEALFSANGYVCAVNGLALTNRAQKGFRDVKEIWRDNPAIQHWSDN